MKIQHIFLCELLNTDDSSRVSCVVFKTKRSARKWQASMNDDLGEEGFSASDRMGCVAVIREMKVHI
jgi:hypothetical protein